MITGPYFPVTGSGTICSVEFPDKEMLLMLYVPGGRLIVLFPDKLISLYSPGVGHATVTAAEVGQSVAVLLMLVVPGAGITGGWKVMAWGNSIIPPVICVVLPVRAVMLPDVQAPTPVRGVDKLPLICTLLPLSVWFPFVPTFPPYDWNVGVVVAAPAAFSDKVLES